MTPRLSQLRIIDATALGIILALSAAVYFLAIEPRIEQHRQHHQQQQLYSELSERYQQTEHDLRMLRGHYARVQHSLDHQAIELAPQHGLNRRLNDIAALARQTQLSLARVRPGESEDHDFYYHLAIDLQGTGSFLHVTAFLHQLKQRMPDLGVRALSLQGQPRDLNNQKIDFTIELIWYAAPASHAQHNLRASHTP